MTTSNPATAATAAESLHTEDIWQDFRQHIRTTISERVSEPEDVDDLLQEVFARIHRGLHDLRTPEALVGWLASITNNTIVDHYRRSANRPEMFPLDHSANLSADDSISVGGRIRPTEEVDVENVNHYDERRHMHRLAACMTPMIEGLSELYAAPFRLVEIDGLSQREAANRLEISTSALKSRIQRGRKKIRAALAACCQLEFDTRGRLLDCRSCACGDS